MQTVIATRISAWIWNLSVFHLYDKVLFFLIKKKLKLLMEISKGGPGLDYQSLDWVISTSDTCLTFQKAKFLKLLCWQYGK